jgi:hypothetical protein
VNIFPIYTIKINFLIFFILQQFIQILEQLCSREYTPTLNIKKVKI